MKVKNIIAGILTFVGLTSSVFARDIPGIGLYGNSTIVVDKGLNFTTTRQGTTTFNGLYAEYHGYSNQANFDAYGLGRINGELYMVSRGKNGQDNYLRQGFINSVCKTTTTGTCTNTTPYNTDIGEFYYELTYGFEEMTVERIGPNEFYSNLNICFSKNNIKYCIGLSPRNRTYTQSNLTGTLNLTINTLSYTKFQELNRGNSPYNSFNPPYNEYSCPTVQQLINTYDEQYNTNLCYSSNLIMSGGTIQTITPKSIFELYPTLTDFTQDIGNFNSYCNNASTTTACQTIFENKEEQYTLIAKIPNNVQPMKLYQYCNLSLNYEPTQTTCTITGGGISTGININDIIREIGEGDYTVITPGRPPESTGTGNGNGSVYDNLLGNQEDNTERWNVIQNAKNIIKTMKELYTKFTGIFRGRTGTKGVIPFYITGLILLIVLFKLFKK